GKATRVLDQSRLLEPLLVPYSGHRHQLITIKCQPVIGYLDITEIITAIENSSQVIAREDLALRALFIDKRLHGRKVVMTGAANGPAMAQATPGRRKYQVGNDIAMWIVHRQARPAGTDGPQ